MKISSIIRRIISVTMIVSILITLPSYAQTPVDPAKSTSESATSESSTAVQVPDIAAEGAILMDADSGKILYEKNADKQFFPASITKMMTALLVIENCKLDDNVQFSKMATTNLESGAVSLGVSEGDVISVKDCLYGLLLKSANEVANGLAEHVGGSVSGFADMMNEKARSLGCTNTNFANPNGLNNSQHLTTPHDMALIAKACFANNTYREINKTLTYSFPATKNNSQTTSISLGHKMLYPSDSRYYEGVFGGKTGYTSKAGNTLVTGASRDGVTLIVVIMKAKQTQYTDTKALLDYGFALEAKSTTKPDIQETTDGESKETTTAITQETKTDEQGIVNVIVGVGPGVHGWVNVENKWYYYDEYGSILKNTTTPDGYKVDGDGVWIE